ncbi:MAG: septum formation initiator family protein [Acidobacteriota bacterium]
MVFKNSEIKKKSIIISIIYIALIIIITIFFGNRGYYDLYQAKKEYRKLEEEIKTLSLKKENLEKELKLIKECPEYYEKIAREKLWMVKPDEKVIVIKK